MQALTLKGTMVLADAEITIITLGEDTHGMFINSNEYIVMCKHHRALHACTRTIKYWLSMALTLISGAAQYHYRSMYEANPITTAPWTTSQPAWILHIDLKTTNISIYHGKCTLSNIKLTDTLNKNELVNASTQLRNYYTETQLILMQVS